MDPERGSPSRSGNKQTARGSPSRSSNKQTLDPLFFLSQRFLSADPKSPSFSRFNFNILTILTLATSARAARVAPSVALPNSLKNRTG